MSVWIGTTQLLKIRSFMEIQVDESKANAFARNLGFRGKSKNKDVGKKKDGCLRVVELVHDLEFLFFFNDYRFDSPRGY